MFVLIFQWKYRFSVIVYCTWFALLHSAPVASAYEGTAWLFSPPPPNVHLFLDTLVFILFC